MVAIIVEHVNQTPYRYPQTQLSGNTFAADSTMCQWQKPQVRVSANKSSTKKFSVTNSSVRIDAGPRQSAGAQSRKLGCGKLDQQVGLEFGLKERGMGALQKNRKEHGC